MVRLGTYCNQCCFFNFNNKECFRGLLDIYKDNGATIQVNDDNVIIDRVCMSRRTYDWLGDMTLEQASTKASNEIYIHGSIILVSSSLDHLRKCLETLKTIKNISKFKLIITHSSAIRSSDVLNLCDSLVDYTEFICMKTFISEPEVITYEAFKRANNGYIFILDTSKDFDPLFIDKVNHTVNIKLHRLLHVEPIDEAYHQSVSMAIIYKVLKGDIGLSISSKINELVENQDNKFDQIKTWGQINEQYSS